MTKRAATTAPFLELTKDFQPERRARIDAIKAKLREDMDLTSPIPPETKT